MEQSKGQTEKGERQLQEEEKKVGSGASESVVTEAAVQELLEEFKQFDKGGKGELLEHEAMLLIESR